VDEVNTASGNLGKHHRIMRRRRKNDSRKTTGIMNRHTTYCFSLPNNACLLCYITFIHDFYTHSSKYNIKVADMVPQKTEDNTVSTNGRQQM